MRPSGTSDPPHVLVVGLGGGVIERLRRSTPTLAIEGVAELQQAIPRIDGAVALIGVVSPSILRRAAALRWVHLFAAGVERFLLPDLIAAPIEITCERGLHSPAVADHAMALLLGLSRGLAASACGRRGRTSSGAPGPALRELAGKTAVIVGFGGIGRAIAERARGFGLEIVAVARAAAAPPAGVSRVLGRDRLDEALALADVLFVAVPLTQATLGMFDAAALSRLPRGALVINVGRGPVIDTDALTRALAGGHLGGAGLDVSDPEPLPADHPLWGREDVLITPHVAGLSDRVLERRVERVADNLRRFAAGAPLLGRVDRAEGY